MGEDALHSLYGQGHLDAIRTRECVAMPGVREQRVLSPQSIADGLRTLWPWGVVYDAAGAPDSLIDAQSQSETRGLIDLWPDYTYCNPPYGTSLFDPVTQMWPYIVECYLREQNKAEKERTGKKTAIKWPPGLPLKKANLSHWLKQHTKSRCEAVVLVPNRTNRKWLRRWREQCDGLIELNPLAFHGRKSSFPAPLVLGYTGQNVDGFHEAFRHLGDPVRRHR